MTRALSPPANFPIPRSALMPALSHAWALASEWMFAMGVRLADQDKPLVLKLLVEMALIAHALLSWLMAPDATVARAVNRRHKVGRARHTARATTRRAPTARRAEDGLIHRHAVWRSWNGCDQRGRALFGIPHFFDRPVFLSSSRQKKCRSTQSPPLSSCGSTILTP
jgi:hypothetical protein